VDTNWQDTVLERVITPMLISPYQVVTKTKYFFQEPTTMEGIINSNALERITARTNVSHQVSDRFTTGMNLSFSRSK
jgi:hypothetical protein